MKRAKKLGRNDPCWCGSGRKYKKCHLSREHEEVLPQEAVIENLRSSFTIKYCLHPAASPSTCSKIGRAHTIQRKGMLETIVDSSNHVLTLNRMYFRDTSREEPINVGWRVASTFPGFCAKHDDELFGPVEKAPFKGSPEQCFLIGYRALAHEVYQKAAMSKGIPKILDFIDRGKPPQEQRILQERSRLHYLGVQRGLNQIQHFKSMADQIVISKAARF